MKSRSSPKHLALGLFTLLALAAGGAQAGNDSCLLQGPAQISQAAPALVSTPQFQERMRWIEQALREGRISPYDAGRLMRQQWELAQFQQGFLAGTSPARTSDGNGGCGVLNPDLAAKLAPLGDLAISGMQSAGSLMRSLMRETERLIQEKADRSAL
jgi:hypothetical protein